MGGEQRLCWGRTKGEDKDYFKPVLITAPNRDWGWERSCHREAGETIHSSVLTLAEYLS